MKILGLLHVTATMRGACMSLLPYFKDEESDFAELTLLRLVPSSFPKPELLTFLVYY